jgi:hypothetical protein
LKYGVPVLQKVLEVGEIGEGVSLCTTASLNIFVDTFFACGSRWELPQLEN